MKFSICNEMFEEWKWEDVFKYAGELGYDGVEVAHFTLCDSVTEVSKAERERLRKSADNAGVEIVGIHWVFVSPKGLHISHPDEKIRAESRYYLHELVDFCGDLGGRVCVLGSPKQRSVEPPEKLADAWKRSCDMLRRVGEVAAGRDVVLAFEPGALFDQMPVLGDHMTVPTAANADADHEERGEWRVAELGAGGSPRFRRRIQFPRFHCPKVSFLFQTRLN